MTEAAAALLGVPTSEERVYVRARSLALTAIYVTGSRRESLLWLADHHAQDEAITAAQRIVEWYWS